MNALTLCVSSPDLGQSAEERLVVTTVTKNRVGKYHDILENITIFWKISKYRKYDILIYIG
jgi:hypothetical protein